MHELRLAIRALRAAPLVSAAAIVSLTVGIGANTAVFSVNIRREEPPEELFEVPTDYHSFMSGPRLACVIAAAGVR